MNRRQARKMSRRMAAKWRGIQAPPPADRWLPGPPSALIDHLIRQAQGFRLAHNAFMDETPPERERFSGCISLTAQRRNLERLRYQIAPAARTIFCGKYTLRFIKEWAQRRA